MLSFEDRIARLERKERERNSSSNIDLLENAQLECAQATESAQVYRRDD